MQYKKFRSQMFVIGDLVVPAWSPKEPHGLGIVYDIVEDGIYEKICVCWQLKGTSEEHLSDIKVIQQTLD
jgi:hypothetical protein